VALSASLALALAAPALAGNNISANEPYQTWGQAKTGALNFRGTDSDSVYSLDLKKGNLIVATMTGSKGSDYDMYLFGPAAVSIFDSSEIASSETSGTSSESIRYTVKGDGFHYLDIVTWDTSGTFSVDVKVAPIVTFSRSSSQTAVDYSRGTAPSGLILSGTVHPGVPQNTLAMWQDPAGTAQRKITKGFSSTGASCSLTLAGDTGEKPYETSTYHVAFSGAPGFFAESSASVKVPVKPLFASWSKITTNVAITTTSAPKSVLLTGVLQTSKFLPSGERVTLERSSSSGFSSATSLGSVPLGSNGRFEYRLRASAVSSRKGTYYIRPRYSGTARWEGSLLRSSWWGWVKITVVD
jgi:hypothetical protein